MTKCFSDFEGWGNTGLSKAANLQRIIDRNGLRSPVLVGDTFGDQRAARECGLPFVHVDYGFGECHRADRRFSSFTALTDWLCTDSTAPQADQNGPDARSASR